jgi:hypothetical protein
MTLELVALFHRIVTTTTALSSKGILGAVDRHYVNGRYIECTTTSFSNVSIKTEAVGSHNQQHNSTMDQVVECITTTLE